MKKREKTMKVPVLYALDDEATEWSEWELELTPKEARIYRRAVRWKKDLQDVFKLGDALDRAEEEIKAMCVKEIADFDPKKLMMITFLDPNYGNEPPDYSPFICILRREVDILLRADFTCKTEAEYRAVLESLRGKISAFDTDEGIEKAVQSWLKYREEIDS